MRHQISTLTFLLISYYLFYSNKYRNLLKRMVEKFDFTKLWYYVHDQTFFIPKPSDVILIADKIKRTYGGILPKNSYIMLSNYIGCKYNVVVIKDHPCVILKMIGGGRYGKVYKAYDMYLNKLVAVKSQAICYKETIAKQVAATRNNGIGLVDCSCNIGPSYVCDGNGYFILPLADTSFDKWVVKKDVAGEYKLIIIALIKIAEDLIRLHESKKVHLDIKTDNIFVLDDIPYIGDFGKVEKTDSYIQIAKASHKNYPHCAPEYFSDINPNQLYLVDPAFDLYSFGALIRDISLVTRNKKYAQEFKNISNYLCQFKPHDRKSLRDVIKYLRPLVC